MSFELIPISNLGKVSTGKTPSKSQPDFYGNLYPFVSPTEVVNSEKLLEAQVFLSENGAKHANLVPKNSVLVTCIGNLGRVGIAEEVLATNQQINTVTFNEELIFYKYGFYALKNLKRTLEHIAPSTTVPIIKKSLFEEQCIPVPKLETQKHIATVLDRAEALKQKRQQALAMADEYLRATFLDLFGDPITNPKVWGKQPMIQVCDFENGDRSSKYPSGSDLVEGGILFLNTKNIVNGFLSFKETNFITEQKFSELSRGKLQKNDLVITLRGTLANCAIFDCKYNTGFINAQIMIIRPHDDKINSVFLHALINSSPIQSYLKSLGQGAAVPQLTATQLKTFEVMVPPKTEQDKFEKIVKKVEALKAKMQTSETEIEHLAKSLSQKAFRGELVK